MVYDSVSFGGFNAKFHRDELDTREAEAHNKLAGAETEVANRLIKKEAHQSDVAKRIEELGLKSGDRVIYDDGISKKVLTIKEIDPIKGKITFEESKVDVGVFSPNLKKYQE